MAAITSPVKTPVQTFPLNATINVSIDVVTNTPTQNGFALKIVLGDATTPSQTLGDQATPTSASPTNGQTIYNKTIKLNTPLPAQQAASIILTIANAQVDSTGIVFGPVSQGE